MNRFFPEIAHWMWLLLYIHSVGETCVVTAPHGSPCCPKYFNQLHITIHVLNSKYYFTNLDCFNLGTWTL